MLNNKKLNMKNAKKEIKEADLAVSIAKKEIKKAEKATNKAHEEVVEAAIVSNGLKRKDFVSAARDLEKAVYLTSESCESVEEADFKIKNSKKRVLKR
jgi:cupin superfamily acireductone dioxygenase involved in methionine salvage